MPQSKTPSKETFINEMKSLKQQHGSLKKFLSKHENTLAFFDNQPIHDYLTRAADTVSFADTHPALDNNPAEKDKNDFYEIKVYQALTFFSDYYRNAALDSQYYLRGGGNKVKQVLDNEFSNLNKSHVKDGIFISHVQDVYQIRHSINAMCFLEHAHALANYLPPNFNNNCETKFVLFPNWKDDHATVLVTILDPNNKKPLATLFVNSFQNEDYTNYIKYRFNYRGYYNYYLQHDDIEPVMTRMKTLNKNDITEGLIIDSAQKTAYSLNQDDELYNSNYYRAHKDIDLLFGMDSKGSFLSNKLFVLNNIPFIDASHNLQLEEDDMNCTIYGYNFLNAIVTMLTNSDNAQKIYALAEKVNNNDEDAKLALQKTFQEYLKSYLPCYYDADNQIKPYAAIKEHHLKQRWNIENQAIAQDIETYKQESQSENNVSNLRAKM